MSATASRSRHLRRSGHGTVGVVYRPLDRYPEEAFSRQGGCRPGTNGSGRSPFARDRDRVLYSGAFRRLDGKTQVVAAGELGNFHNRLTHSLKVAQVGRTMATRLNDSMAGEGPDPDLVEAACLAHDIGHPPFGHAGETALSGVVDELKPGGDGFEGNAQNLRILTALEVHDHVGARGLHLTRATLAATVKYPWRRDGQPDDQKAKYEGKWGAYATDAHVLDWLIAPRPEAGPFAPVEKQIMDWADDVAYACHDMEDFYRRGVIPLDRLLQFHIPEDSPAAAHEESDALRDFFDFLEEDWREEREGAGFERARANRSFRFIASVIPVTEPYRGTTRAKASLHAGVSRLISFLCDSASIQGPGCWYGGTLEVDDDRRYICNLLKKLIWYYVIKRPALAGQQHGQRRVVKQLLTWHSKERSLLPEDRLEELLVHQDLVRAACDHVASLTEHHALALHRRLSGIDTGAVTDLV